MTATGSDNRLETDGTYSYQYDAEGNLILRTEVATPGNARVFEYDYRNRLTAVGDYTGYVDPQNPGTLVMEAEYTYDVSNLRIKKVVDLDGEGAGAVETTGFVYDRGQVVLQFDGAGNAQEKGAQEKGTSLITAVVVRLAARKLLFSPRPNAPR